MTALRALWAWLAASRVIRGAVQALTVLVSILAAIAVAHRRGKRHGRIEERRDAKEAGDEHITQKYKDRQSIDEAARDLSDDELSRRLRKDGSGPRT